jgi:hypothetical protein
MEAARGAAERFRDGGCGGFPSGIGGAGRSAAGGLGASPLDSSGCKVALPRDERCHGLALGRAGSSSEIFYFSLFFFKKITFKPLNVLFSVLYILLGTVRCDGEAT